MTLKNIPLAAVHESLGGKMVPFAGYNMPVRYTSDKEEHLAVRNGVGVFDVSHMGEFFLRGSSALDLIQWVTSNDASKIEIGQAQYSCLPNDRGGIVDDLIVYRLAEQEYMLVVNASNIEKDWNWIKSQDKWGVDMQNRSDEMVLLAVQGPKASDVLQKLTDEDLSTISFYRFRKGILAEKEMIISATGYTGAGGFELYIRKEDAEAVWKALFDAGQDANIQPIGLGARDTLRLEMGYCLYGNDIDDGTSPLEAGLGWITKFTKDFVNVEALKAQKEVGVKRKLIGFEMIERGIPRHGYEIVDDEGNKLGEVTSGTMSPSLNIGIGMGYVPLAYAKSGTAINIAVRNKRIKAIVKRPPFVK